MIPYRKIHAQATSAHLPSPPHLITSTFNPLSLSRPLQTLLTDIRIYISLLSSHISGLSAPTSKELAVHRNLLQYRLLNLGPQTDPIGEVVRLAAIVFDLGVLWPVLVWKPWAMVLGMLEAAMRRLDSRALGGEDGVWEDLFWAATMGAMMGGGEGYFMGLLGRMLDDGMVRFESFEGMRERMKGFLWLDEGCEIGCRVVWERLAGMRV